MLYLRPSWELPLPMVVPRCWCCQQRQGLIFCTHQRHHHNLQKSRLALHDDGKIFSSGSLDSLINATPIIEPLKVFLARKLAISPLNVLPLNGHLSSAYRLLTCCVASRRHFGRLFHRGKRQASSSAWCTQNVGPDDYGGTSLHQGRLARHW